MGKIGDITLNLLPLEQHPKNTGLTKQANLLDILTTFTTSSLVLSPVSGRTLEVQNISETPDSESTSIPIPRQIFIPAKQSPTKKVIYCYLYDRQRTFTLQNIADYTGIKYETVRKTFQRLSNKINLFLKTTIIQPDLDYVRVNPRQLFAWDKLSHAQKKITKDMILVFATGFFFILSAMRSELKDAMLNVSLRFFLQYSKRQQQFNTFLPLLSSDEAPLQLPELNQDMKTSTSTSTVDQDRLGTKENSSDISSIPESKHKKRVAITGHLVDSLAESMIVCLLDRLHIDFQVGMYFYEHRMNLDFYLKDHDIYLEYWGVQNNSGYDQRRKEKEAKIKELGLRVLSIEADEVNNAPKLEKRLQLALGVASSEELRRK